MLTQAEIQRRMLLSLIFSAAEWIDSLVNEWNYYVGDEDYPRKFLEDARYVGWEPRTSPEDYDWDNNGLGHA